MTTTTRAWFDPGEGDFPNFGPNIGEGIPEINPEFPSEEDGGGRASGGRNGITGKYYVLSSCVVYYTFS